MPWEFAIDGPGGERINGIEVYLSFMDDETSCEIYGQGALESIKVCVQPTVESYVSPHQVHKADL